MNQQPVVRHESDMEEDEGGETQQVKGKKITIYQDEGR